MINVGVWIQAFRKERGYTQKQLAEMLGLSIITIQNYENGRRKPDIEILYSISKALEVDIALFFEDSKFTESLSREVILSSYIEEECLLGICGNIEKYVSCIESEDTSLSKEKVKELVEKIKYLIEFETYMQMGKLKNR